MYQDIQHLVDVQHQTSLTEHAQLVMWLLHRARGNDEGGASSGLARVGNAVKAASRNSSMWPPHEPGGGPQLCSSIHWETAPPPEQWDYEGRCSRPVDSGA